MSLIKKLNLEELEKYSFQNKIPVIRPQSAQLLYDTVHSLKPELILEIGTAVGFSGTIILKAAPINAFLTTIEKDKFRANYAKSIFSCHNLNNVQIIVNDAQVVLKDLVIKNSKFDFIFLDGPKGQYIKYLPMLKELLVNGGTLFCDNVNFQNFMFNNENSLKKFKTIIKNLKLFNSTVKDDKSLAVNFYDIEDGVAIIKKLS